MTNPTSPTSENVTEKARTVSKDLGASARDAAQDAASAARDEAARRAEGAKENVADEVSDVASALRKAADDMRDGSPQERTMGQIAGGLADVSDTIRGKDLGEVANDLSAFAKRNPLVFLGGAALAGFAATRFATASARRNDGPEPETAASIHSGPAATPVSARPTPTTPTRTGGTS